MATRIATGASVQTTSSSVLWLLRDGDGWTIVDTGFANDAVRELIMMGANSVELRKKAIEEGMLTLRMSGLEKIKSGVTTVEEVLRERARFGAGQAAQPAFDRQYA